MKRFNVVFAERRCWAHVGAESEANSRVLWRGVECQTITYRQLVAGDQIPGAPRQRRMVSPIATSAV